MGYTTVALKEKILEMYPEIEQHHLSTAVTFSPEKDAYLVTLSKGKDSLVTHVARQDADECMNGIKCVYLGVQVAQFLKNFEERRIFSRTAA